MCVRVCMCVCTCERVCVRACACVRAHARACTVCRCAWSARSACMRERACACVLGHACLMCAWVRLLLRALHSARERRHARARKTVLSPASNNSRACRTWSASSLVRPWIPMRRAAAAAATTAAAAAAAGCAGSCLRACSRWLRRQVLARLLQRQAKQQGSRSKLAQPRAPASGQERIGTFHVCPLAPCQPSPTCKRPGQHVHAGGGASSATPRDA